jgi:hypothetical protein
MHLTEQTDDLGEPGWDQYYGYGRLNAYEAVNPPPRHNLKIYLQAPSALAPGSSATVNVSVYNSGQEDESNVYAEMWINDSLVQSIVFPEVISGTYVSFSYDWLMIDEGSYNLTAYVSPVIDESKLIDNSADKRVIISYDLIGFIFTHGETSLGNTLKRFYEGFGYYIDEITSPISTSLLNNYRYIFVGENGGTWSAGEVAAMESYIQEGGIFVGIGDTGPADGTSQIAANHGIIFDGYRDAYLSGPTSVINLNHPLMENVSTILLPSLLNTLIVNNSAVPIIWDKNGSYIYGAAVDVGSGHLLVLSDDLFDHVYSFDNEIMFANILTWSSWQPPDHDLSTYLEAPITLFPQKTVLLNITVNNRGAKNEINVEVQLWINDNLVDIQNFPNLPVGASEAYNYAWTPTLKGDYNVTVYVVPVKDEIWISNNYDMTLVKVQGGIGSNPVILFDEAHNPQYSIDSNPAYGSIGGYKEFANMLTNAGYTIGTINPGTLIDDSTLEEADILVIVASQYPYMEEELDVIKAWVETGGRLLLISDWGTFSTQMDLLTNKFGLDFANNRLHDSDDNVVADYDYRLFYNDNNLLPHPITFGISRVEMYAGDGLITTPSDAIPIICTDDDGTATWENGSIASKISVMSILESGYAGIGRLCVIGDSNLWDSAYDADNDGSLDFFDSDNQILALNTINWLSTTIDSESPIFTFTPNDITYLEGTTGHKLNWTAIDSHPETYTILQDGMEIKTGNWVSNVPTILEIDGLTKGVYVFKLTLFDQSNNSASHTVTVTVTDIESVPPVFIVTPNDFTYSEGTTGHTISWTVVDINPDSYTLYEDGEDIGSGSWTSNTPIIFSVDGLSLDSYNYTLVIKDLYGNFATDTVIVTVIDTTVPNLSAPVDISYEEEAVGNVINWIAIDTHPDTYHIYQDGMEVKTESWVSDNPITISVDGLTVGSYNYTLIVKDSSMNSAIDTVMVTVYNVSTPLLIHHDDITYERGSTGNNISWAVISPTPITYILYINETKVDNGSNVSANTIVVSIDGLAVGSYNYTLKIINSLGTASDTVMVKVVENTSPTSIDRSETTNQEGKNAIDNSPKTQNGDTSVLLLSTLMLGNLSIVGVTIKKQFRSRSKKSTPNIEQLFTSTDSTSQFLEETGIDKQIKQLEKRVTQLKRRQNY